MGEKEFTIKSRTSWLKASERPEFLILGQPFTSCVFWGKLINLFEPSFPHMLYGVNSNTGFVGLL